jgi:beta-1,4-N-acetylglucosaminyltransferase
MSADVHSPSAQAETATVVFSQPIIDAEHHRSIFVTVGSTGFDALVHTVMSTPFLRAALRIGYRRITVQYGHSKTAFMAALSHRDTDDSVRYHYNALTNELVVRWLNNDKDKVNGRNDLHRVDTSQLTMTVSGFDFRPSLAGDTRLADLIISHAGGLVKQLQLLRQVL